MEHEQSPGIYADFCFHLFSFSGLLERPNAHNHLLFFFLLMPGLEDFFKNLKFPVEFYPLTSSPEHILIQTDNVSEHVFKF